MTEQWDFVVVAYALTGLLTAAVLGESWRAMRRAEGRADMLRQERS